MHRPTSCITKSIDKLRIIDYFSINRNSSISYRVLDDIIYSCTKQGFLVLENHLVDTSLLKDCYTASNLFFDLPKDNKEKYSYLKSDQKKFSNVGYFHLFSEIALGAEYPDNKEFFHIGPKITGKHPLYKVCANNIFPEEIVSFESNYTNLYKSLQDIGNTTLLAIASAFNLDKNYIEKLIKFGNSVLRVVNYPENKGLGLGMRAAPHTGIQLLGIQPPATDRGLELFSQGEWIEISPKLIIIIFRWPEEIS
ncbi:MAG: 2-oxoglutarate and iron-dependent oxygenase domain-containing protein, partial [Bacteroidota bacterium]